MRKAFTLIELMVTIAIIAILAGIAAVSYAGVRERGRDAQRKNDLSEIKLALSSYYSAQSPAQYVQSNGSTPPGAITLDNQTDALSAALKPNYIKNVPLDPLNTGNNVYQYQSLLVGGVNTGFNLFATLENQNDKSGWNGGSSWVAFGYVVTNE